MPEQIEPVVIPRQENYPEESVSNVSAGKSTVQMQLRPPNNINK
jgi:hypothetical protein